MADSPLPPPPSASDSPPGPMPHQLRLFFIALQFFTRLPVPRRVGFRAEWLQQSTRYFPLVGWVVAAVAALVYVAAARFWPPQVAVVLSTAAGIWVTGAFHEDGFADTCDGLGGSADRARALEIMRDSRLGAYGVIGIMLLLLVKMVCLGALLPWQVLAALGVAHAVSRWLATCLICAMPYVREQGKAKPLAQHMRRGEFMVATCFAAIPVVAVPCLGLLSWSRVLAGLVLAALAAAWLARVFARRLGGYTGDCLGAVQQLSETAFYLGALATLPSLSAG